MANNHNLRRLSPSEAREFGKMGGKASGEARRKKADFRRTMNALLTAEIDNPEWSPFLKELGLDSTLEAAVNAAMIREALRGNVKAYTAIKDVIGQTSKSEDDIEEQRLRMNAAKTKMCVDDGETEDDGFIDALQGTVENDWEEWDVEMEEASDL